MRGVLFYLDITTDRHGEVSSRYLRTRIILWEQRRWIRFLLVKTGPLPVFADHDEPYGSTAVGELLTGRENTSFYSTNA